MDGAMSTAELEPGHYAFPEASRFGKKLPKEKIYQYATPTNAIKQLFIKRLDRIIWQFKLAPETINIPATQSVPEIQVFDLYLKPDMHASNAQGLAIDETVLRSIDKAIAFPIYYRIRWSNKVQYAMAYKRPSEAGKSQWVVGDYFYSEHLQEIEDSAANTQHLPVMLNLAALYEYLLKTLITEPARPNETLSKLIERLSLIRNKQRELNKLETHLHREKQFNRKIDINQQVNRIKTELADLMASQ